jgi:NADH-quinone oxidoreductase subunit N
VLVVTSVAGLFYYLRIVVALYSAPQEQAAPLELVSRGGALILAVLAILLIWFGVYPAPLLDLIRTSMEVLN